MKLKYTLIFGVGLLLVLAFVSCQLATEATTATLPPAITANVASLSTVSPLPTLTMEAKETTPTPTVVVPRSSPTTIPSTITSSATLAPPTIVPATLTPLPTLTAEELETAVAELLANPMNCDVPCWWGAIPDITSFNEVKHAISPYNFHISEYEEGGEVVHLLVETGSVDEQGYYEIGIVYNFSQSILAGVTGYSSSISETLAKFGPPDEVWLETMSFERESLPVRLNMVYLQEGMAVGYVVDGNIQGDVAMGCFADEEIGLLRLITPASAISYRDFSPIFGRDRRYLLLEEATDMTMDDFMQQFSDPTQPQCIETPAELWE